jgi:hypothetical protein
VLRGDRRAALTLTFKFRDALGRTATKAKKLTLRRS